MDIEFTKESLNLNDVIVKNPISTFYGRVKGTSMKGAGVDDGDLLVIDKSLEYKQGALAVCCINGEFTLKYIQKRDNKLYLVPANPDFQPIKVSEDDEFAIWGIVSYIVKKTF